MVGKHMFNKRVYQVEATIVMYKMQVTIGSGNEQKQLIYLLPRLRTVLP